MKTLRRTVFFACAVAALWQGLCAQSGGAPVRNFREACEHGSAADVEFFLKNGADANASFYGLDLSGASLSGSITPLVAAAQSNTSAQTLQALIKAGAQVNPAVDANLNFVGRRPLFYAAVYNPVVDILSTLIAAGADVNAGSAVYVCAQKNANPAVFKRLFESGAWVGSPALLLWNAAQNPSGKMLPTVVESLGGVDALDKDGNSALFWAACFGGAKDAAALLRAGAAVNRMNAEGWTPLGAAMMHRNVAVATLFLENGADPELLKKVDETGIWGTLFRTKDERRAFPKTIPALEELKALLARRKIEKTADLELNRFLIVFLRFKGLYSPQGDYVGAVEVELRVPPTHSKAVQAAPGNSLKLPDAPTDDTPKAADVK